MFYSVQVLNRKGPLGVIWLAAHMDNRLKKTNVFEANLVGSVDSILNPEVPLALRLSGQLLLGVVNIYKKKVLYLFEDCTDAISKMQQAFKSGAPVLQNGGKAAPIQVTITDDYLLASMDNFAEDDFNFKTFDLSQPLDLGINSPASLMMAEDGAAAFTTPISYNVADEQFDVDEEELERSMSLGTAEKLRDANAPAMRSLYDAQNGFASPRKGEEVLADIPPEDELYIGGNLLPPPSPPSSTGRGPHSAGRDSGIGDIGIEGITDILGASDPPLAMLEVEDSERREGSPQKDMPGPARLKAGGKRKRAYRDIDANGQPATVIPTSHIRSLMADRKPLLKAQKRLTKASVRGSVADPLQVQPDGDPSEAWLLMPAITQRMAPALYGLYTRSLYEDEIDETLETAAQEQDEVGDTEQAVNETLLENGTLAQAIQSEQDQGGGPDIAAHDQVDDGHQNVGTGYPVEVIMTPFGGEADDHQPPPSSNRQRESDWASPGSAEHDDAISYVRQDDFSAKTQSVLKQVKYKLKCGNTASKGREFAKSSVPFHDLHAGASRSQAARLFFELLVLHSRKKVQISQDLPYATINVSLPGTLL